jgi:hypothetical protein
MVKENIGMTISQPFKPALVAEVAAHNMGEVMGLNRLLHQLDRVDNSGGNVTIKAEGWKHIEELSKSDDKSDLAFIALWFDPFMDAFRSAATKVVVQCGYRPLFIDAAEFNGFIMDQVITSIRQARFIIADYTCKAETTEEHKVKHGVRGGVYWEAGLAFGMGKQVIHTCLDSDESKNRLHFDVAQYRTIFWKPEELSKFEETLTQRILATVGKGTYTPSA